MTTGDGEGVARTALNKVPEVTLAFWVIKITATAVGETAADYLNETIGLGLTLTTGVTLAALAAALVVQMRTRRYVPAAYWLTVVLVSVSGTLLADNLTDGMQVPLELSTPAFGVAFAMVLTAWFRSERTLAMHSIVTPRREAFYWAAILCSFALGTAAGDYLAEALGLGYLVSAAAFAGAIAVDAVAWRTRRVDPVAGFWIAYVLTRPMGASIGDLLTQPPQYGGLGLGTTWTTVGFSATIVALVSYLTVTRADATEVRRAVNTADAA